MMSRGPDETPDLMLVYELLFAQHGLLLQRFDQAETRAGKTPDFRVLRGRALAAYCEVKSPRDDWLLEQIEAAPAGVLAGGLRSDPVFNRIARHVRKAAGQFDAVNPDRALPNILVFVNHDRACHYGDLHETLTGHFLASDGTRHPTMLHIAEDLLGQIKTRIDLYAWIDVRSRRVEGFVCNEASPRHVAVVGDLLGLDTSRIRH